MHYQLREAGEPVLLLHGFLEEGKMWDKLLKGIEGCQFIIPDLPGHGASFEVENEMSMGTMADALLSLMDELKIPTVHIIGHSMGAYIAMEIIRKAPERVDSILFFQSTATPDSSETKLKRDRAAKAVMENKNLYIRTVVNALFTLETKDQHQPEIDRLVEEALHMTASAIAKVTLGMKNRIDATELMAQFEKPKGYFLGEEDPVLPIDRMQKELQKVEPNRFYVHPTMGHMAHIEAPEDANMFLKMWLEFTVQS
ncbi:MAG: pimeloyl-ACP methyl ester carboxylesterase [Flavobacteriales bacterium]|jgi:pimeloyl-ACP methyl ester carboxylesterase